MKIMFRGMPFWRVPPPQKRHLFPLAEAISRVNHFQVQKTFGSSSDYSVLFISTYLCASCSQLGQSEKCQNSMKVCYHTIYQSNWDVK